MRKTPLFTATIIILTCSFILMGCTNQPPKIVNTTTEVNTSADVNNTTSISKPAKLTAEDIKKKYTDAKIKSMQNIGENFILVESQQDTLANKFDIYNLTTGTVDTLPTMPDFVTLEKAVNENYFIFLDSGKNSESPFVKFPHLKSCIRVKNGASNNGNFIVLEEDKYFNLDYSVQAGSKEGSLMSDLNISFDGLQVAFEPVKGKELAFFADDSDIPPTKVTYNKDTKQIVFEIGTSELSKKISGMKKVNIANNKYLSSYGITQKDNKTYLAVTLTDLTKNYMVKIKKLPSGLPYFTVVFEADILYPTF